jgi:AraC-like DNA-binding protein
VDVSFNARRLERTHRDVRADAVDHYYVLFQMIGRSMIVQNDRTTELDVGGVALVDAALPTTYLAEAGGHWASLQLSRRSVTSHLGSEPRCPCEGRGATAARLLRQLLHEGVENGASTSADAYMRLVIYDLTGALFAPFEGKDVLRHTDKLFARICAIVRDGFADPAFGPGDVADQAGISLRYLQKLFTQRNSTCTQFINAVRLDHALALLKRRSALRTSQSISDIAYASGYSDYTNFHRRFRCRFGQTPGSIGGEGRGGSDGMELAAR